MAGVSLYQMVLTLLIMSWVVAITLIWVRFDNFPHAKLMLWAVLLWPFLLADEWLKLSGGAQSLHFLIGIFQFTAVCISALLLLAIRQLTSEQSATFKIFYFAPTLVILLAQLPLMLTPSGDKLAFLMTPVTGELLQNWWHFSTYLLTSFVILVLAVLTTDSLSSYHHHLSDQVVDVDIYQLRFVSTGFFALMIAAFSGIIMVGFAVFEWTMGFNWQSIINITQASVLLFLILLLLERRKYSPSPFTAKQLVHAKFSDDYLKLTLKKAEKAIIRHKAYKRVGLRIKQLADVAEVEPLALALATRSILKRNFRAFIYHYRLEYAKKVLMRTDARVTTVAKKLGFDSEKYLSTVFVKYIQMMNKGKIEQKKAG